jgi:hypothetical protein
MAAPPPLARCAERRIQAAIRLAAVEIKEAGGDEALADYLRSTLTTVLAVALAERGSEEACRLLTETLITAEHCLPHA